MIFFTCCSEPFRADDRRRLPPDHERQHDLGCDGVHARSRGVEGHLLESTGTAHKTAKGTKVSVRTVKAPGFGPKGVLRCILPFTIFLKLKDIGGNVLPPYDEVP